MRTGHGIWAPEGIVFAVMLQFPVRMNLNRIRVDPPVQQIEMMAGLVQ